MGLLVIILLQAVYIFSTEKPVHNSVTNDVPEIAKFVSREKISRKLIYAKPICELEVQSISVADDGYTAILSSKNKSLEIKKGQSISSTVEVSSISSLGVTLHHSEFQHYLPIDETIIQNDEDSFIGFRENEAFPEAGPVEGLLLKKIPEPYHSDISVISDNVLSVRRQVFDGILESREILSSMNFAISSKGGFQATKIEEDSLFASLGIETGDVIKTINGRDLNSVSDVVSMYRQLNVTESLEMRFERQGQEVFYFYQLVD